VLRNSLWAPKEKRKFDGKDRPKRLKERGFPRSHRPAKAAKIAKETKAYRERAIHLFGD
jgi:hypothetical protein